MNDQTEVSPVDSSTSVDHAPLPIESFFEGTAVRSVKKDDDWWFVASDIAKALEFRDAGDMVKMVEDDEKGTHPVRTLGGDQEMLLINEKGFYRAIFRSNKKSVKPFQDWVFGDLLPTLRKEGTYHMALKHLPERLYTPERIEEVVDNNLPALPKSERQLQIEAGTLFSERPTAYAQREAARETLRTKLNQVALDYALVRAQYPLFEAMVKTAAATHSSKWEREAEALQERSERFQQNAWTTLMALGLAPEDFPTLEKSDAETGTLNQTGSGIWALDFGNLFEKQFGTIWQKYILKAQKSSTLGSDYGDEDNCVISKFK